MRLLHSVKIAVLLDFRQSQHSRGTMTQIFRMMGDGEDTETNSDILNMESGNEIRQGELVQDPIHDA